MKVARFAGLFVLVGAWACGPPANKLPLPVARGAAAGYDVVLVTLDTTRADHLGCYGDAAAETPVLDRLAREGVRFETAISPVPMTLPAHASILTGLDPPSHGVRHNGQFRLSSEHETLAERLSARGYDTAAFVGSFVLDHRYGLAQGFATYDDAVEPPRDASFGGAESERTAEAVTDAALAWLDRSRGNSTADRAPFFLWVHYYDPHAPYRPPTRAGSSPYDGEIAYVDRELGRLLTGLQAIDRPKLIVVVGDHGESLGEHEEKTHSRLIYDATQRVPWLLWSPSLVHGPWVVPDLVGTVDVTPTILDLLGIDAEGPFDGRSVLAAAPADRRVYLETLAPFLDNGWSPLHGIRTRSAKYILAPRPEYYDLTSDPGETKNLFGPDAPDSLAALEAALEAKLGSASPEDVASETRAVDPDELRRLQSLGYLGGPGPAKPSATGLADPKDMMPVLELLDQAEGARRAGRLDEALERAERAKKGAPSDLEVLQELGILYALAGRLDEAEASYRRYLQAKPNPNVTILLASVLREKGNADEGRALLEEEAKREPDHGGILVTLGDFAAADGRPADALRLYQRAKEVDPARASALADARILELRSRR